MSTIEQVDPPAHARPRRAAPPPDPAPRIRRVASILACAVPMVVIVVMGWRQRWISDDGWINLRVVDQLFAGNGLVYNAGERVETTTSTVWLWLLIVGQAIVGGSVDGRVAVVLGVALSALGVVAATGGSLRWWRLARPTAPDGSLVLPFGMAAFVAVPPVWDFVTSGLETGLAFAWIGGGVFLLAKRATPGASAPVRVAVPIIIGLGPLIRPDLALLSLTFGAALLLQLRGARQILTTVGIAAIVPLLWEVFRAGYYATLVPNTALAKTAGTAAWESGLRYLDDYAGRYGLLLPILAAAIVVVALVVSAVRAASRRVAVTAGLLAAPVGGLLHGSYVVFVGGDFMHGRMLLPATFALLATAAVVVIDRSWWAALLLPLVVVLLWSVFVGWAVRVPYTTDLDPRSRLANERAYWTRDGANRLITVDDLTRHPQGRVGLDLRAIADSGRRVVLIDNQQLIPVDGVTVAARRGNLGVAGRVGGPRVVVLDAYALADPVGSRLDWTATPAPPSRAGHSGRPTFWQQARFAMPTPTDPVAVVDARAALACGEVAELQRAVTEPMSPRRFVDNVIASPRLTTLEIPVESALARQQFCGPTR